MKRHFIKPKAQRDVWVIVTIVSLALLLIVYGKVEGEAKQEPTIIRPVPNDYLIPVVKTAYADFKDQRAKKLFETLSSYNSPLANYADYIVEMADKYGIDYVWVAAISGKESSFGKAIPEGSHNAWGYMTWDSEGNRSVKHFDSWEKGIEAETKLLAENYRDNMAKGIQESYCPSFECSETWVSDVTAFAKQITK